MSDDNKMSFMEHLEEHHHQRGSGGSAANSVIAVSQLGGKGFYSCKVANDTLGHFYLDDLIANGVEESAISVIPEEELAVAAALEMAEPEDLLIIFGDDIARLCFAA